MLKRHILPAIRNMKDFDTLLSSPYEQLILLHTHLGQVKSIVQTAQKKGKKIWIHADMIDGLRNDERGTQFLCQEVKPDGIVSTKKQVILEAKKKGILTIQRLFLLDAQALEHGLSLIEQTKPDYIELLPGIVPSMIEEIAEKTSTPIIASGLIRKKEDIQTALQAGAIAISTSHQKLW